jgi:hypothetical protein
VVVEDFGSAEGGGYSSVEQVACASAGRLWCIAKPNFMRRIFASPLPII